MKKIIALVMALVMMMAVTVPAFAATEEVTVQNGSADQGGEVTVSTTNYEDKWSYTVTIPADVSIPWNDTAVKEMSYTVTSQLLIGASLKVSVAATNGTVLKADGGKTLPYTFTSTGEQIFAEVNDAAKNPAGTDVANTTVQVGNFAGYAIGEYTDILTYTVEYVAP